MRSLKLLILTLFPCMLLVGSIDTEWTAWTEWTPCSRTCDGGVTYQRRTCVGETRCIGERVRYERCNAELCSGSADDFRDAQCTNYNSAPYNEKLYNWTARYEPHDACALWCEVIGLDVYAKLNFKVTDGTRCDKTTRDMCVEGQCWRVGCDDKLGSPVVLDECGVCGGDGSTCRKVNASLPDAGTEGKYIWTETDFSQCSVSCGTGEQRTSLVCRARQSRQPVPHSYCSDLPKHPLRVRMCYRQNCSFSWIADEWGVCSKPCGNGTRRRHVYCTELWSDGSYRSVSDVICASSTSPARLETCNNVKCPKLYDAASENATRATDDIDMTSLSTESSELDNMTAVVSVGAFDSEDGSSIDTRPTKLVPQVAVAPYPVFDSERPSEGSGEGDIMPVLDIDGSAPYRNDRVINEAISTKPRFVPSDWGPCSATCGPGVRRRQVQCKVFSQRYGAVINQPSAVCKDRRPRDTTICNLGVCRAARPVPDAFTWRFSGYGPCSASCAGGVRYPLFTCVNVRDYRPVLHEYCDRVPKPALPTRNCNSGPCPPRWHTFEYGPCSVSCGGGVRIRPVQCVQGVIGSEQFAILPGSICPPPAPSNRVPCNLVDCSPEWAPSEWSKCSVTCGDGVRTRSLSCKQLLYKTHSRVERHLSACNRSTKPSTRETCSLAACPTVAPRRPSRHIVIDRSTYVQLKPQKKVQVLVGGRGVFFPGTVVSVRCTVKRFPRRNVRWRHNGKYVRSKGRIKARNGVLHIRRSRAKDAGLYTCVASNLTADIAIGFQSYDEATEKFRLRVEYIAKNSLFMQRLRERRARHRIKSWKVFTLPYLLDKIGLASIPLGYFAGNWSACSKTCGGAGLMYRDIQCELVQDAYYLQVDDEYCLEKGLTPPIESRDCGYQECPHWEVGPWSECTSNICLRSGVGAITRSLYCVSYGQLFPYHMCNASETPPNQKECPRENCYATWSATSWSECSRTCGGKGVQTRALQCVWITNKQSAGINCRRLHRPSVSRACTSPPCSQTVCKDESSYCSLIPMLRLCHLRQYRTECCLSCKFTLLDSKYLKLAKKHVRQRSRDN